MEAGSLLRRKRGGEGGGIQLNKGDKGGKGGKEDEHFCVGTPFHQIDTTYQNDRGNSDVAGALPLPLSCARLSVQEAVQVSGQEKGAPCS